MLLIKDGKMHRGCMSDRSKSKMFCEKHEKDCYKCNATNCNYLQSFQLNNPIEELLLDGPMSATSDDTDTDADENYKGDDQFEALVSDVDNAYDDSDSNLQNGSDSNNSGEFESKPNKPIHNPYDGNSADLPSFCLLTVAIAAILTQSLPLIMNF